MAGCAHPVTRVLLHLRRVSATLVMALVAANGMSNEAAIFPDRLLWGDTHVHSNHSPDAYFLRNTALAPSAAYAFARGEPVEVDGQVYRINRPLDFLVVSDHAEYIGVFPGLDARDEELLSTKLGQRWIRYIDSGDRESIFDEFVASLWTDQHRYPTSAAFENRIWHRLIRASDRANDPGRFTALTGFEWTSMPGGNNLHRNVIFADGFERTSQVLPFSQLDSADPADLWAYMAAYEAATGGRVLAIPHNGNLSNGMMFSASDFAGEPMTVDYARARSRWEPVIEATQIKGDSEAHPLLSPDDPFADYETWDQSNVAGTQPKAPWMLKYEYARSALRTGLELQHRLGANPYDFGLIGSTDAHTSMPAVEEDNYLGKFILNLPSATRWSENMTGGAADTTRDLRDGNWEQVSSGYAAVWAEVNTRAGIFDALRRKEVYATTGPRIRLRVLAGFDFEPDDLEGADAVRQAYSRGVPMGGRLPLHPAGVSEPLRLLIFAAQDPADARLSHVQVVKGWVDADGKSHERVFDARVADEGAAELNTFWQDPSFDPARPAFYYVRVIQMPSPRWTAYDRDRYGIDMPEHVPMTTRERAYGSPVFYGTTSAQR